MRRDLSIGAALVGGVLVIAACNSIVGNTAHGLATSGTGGANGGSAGSASGGSVGIGGGSGGMAGAVGGATGSGGVTGTGGVTGSGGATGTGGAAGASATGGATGTGGVTGTGGDVGAGGAGVSGGNLVTNGDFSEGVTHWGLTNNSSYALPTYAASNGQLCVMTSGLASFTLGWPSDPPSAFRLSRSASYTFSYQVSTTTTLWYFEAKVGGNAIDFDTTTDVPTSNMQAFAHTFTSPASETAAGVAFNIEVNSLQPASICFEDVSVLKD